MPISAIPSITDTSTGGTTAPAEVRAGDNAMLDRDAFLKLLVAQLKYQDPSKPIDASQMVSQSAQLSMVDKLNDIASALGQQAAGNRLSLAGDIVGKQISFAGPDGYLVSETVDFARFDGDSIVLGAGDWDVPYESVVAVAAAPIAAPSTSEPAPASATEPHEDGAT